MSGLDYPVFDADNHMYETPDALTRHLPKEFDGAVEFVQVRGRTRIAVLGKITEYIPNPTFEVVAPPGAHETYFSGKNTEGLTLRQMTGKPMAPLPAFQEPGPRLEMLDQHGVQTAMIYPTLANLVEHSAQSDPRLVHALISALNRWMHETWSFDYQGRLYCTPVIALPLLDEAIKELDWVLEHGAKVILVRPAPVNGFQGFRSPALPEFDPFWKRVEEAGIPVVIHASQPVLDDYVAMWEPQKTNSAFLMSPFKLVTLDHRDIEDMLTSLICHGTLTRFPNLKIASVENGSDWVGPLFHRLELAYGKMPQNFAEHPIEVFRRNIWVNPFWESDVRSLIDWVGVERIIFGSDYPHPEGLAEPLNYLKYLDGISDADVQKIMSDNAYGLLGQPVPA